MGKAGLVGQKVAATLASTGTKAHFLHPGEAIHGDLGRIHRDDIVLVLSFSGATEEIVRLLPALTELPVPIVAITGRPQSELAQAASVVLDLGPLREACSLGLAPSTSTTAMLALGDALALVLSRMRAFGPEDFARFHPGGSLGRKLAKVDEIMRPLEECRVAIQTLSVREVFAAASRPGRRSGAIMLVDEEGLLTGLFTDSDLARLLERRQDTSLDLPIRDVMTRQPMTVTAGTLMREAVEILGARKFSELPVVDGHGKPLGLIDITDVVSLEPWGTSTAMAASPPETVDTAHPKTLPLSNRLPGHLRT
jgi:arabinose-5-phosphate isomerase